jgi:predicted metal-dependent peptidase
MNNDIEIKLAAARTKLILDKPFLGALVLRLPMLAVDTGWCMTTATDARRLYYNSGYIKKLTVDQTQFVLAHEALHCALLHFARRQHRNKFRWDIACDYAINSLLLKDGLTPPPGVWVHESYEGMTAEEIYPTIDENTDDQPMDQHIYDGESEGNHSNQGQNRLGQEQGQFDEKNPNTVNAEGSHGTSEEESSTLPPPPLTEIERQDLAVHWQQRLAGAAQQALQAGKLSGALIRLIEYLLQPQLPWRMLLARYLNMTARDDYSYRRPSRREGEAIFPSLRSTQINVIVALDISGSVTDDEIAQCLAEINALKGQVRARLMLLACDADLAEGGPWLYEPWDELVLPRQFKGGGGTRFTPVFEYVEKQGLRPDSLLYFTDAQGEFPATAPDYPVIWLVKGRMPVPWGQRIQLN